jgi:RNA polymerase sporulation-specific sigma factor
MENELGRSPTVFELSEQCGLSVEEIAICDRASFRIASIDEPCFDSDSSLSEYIAGEEIEERIVMRETLMRGVETLPEKLSQIIKLRYFHELTQMQTAKIIGVSQVQISRLEKKALQQLRKELL